MKTENLKKTRKKRKNINIKYNLKKNKLLLMLSFFLLIGIFFGAMLMRLADKNIIKLINTLFLSDFKERLTKPLLDIFISSISSTFVFMLIIFFMGLSMWGFILVPMIPLMRGICIGLCEGYLYSVYGLKGICFHSLIFLPGIFISSIALLLMAREAVKISNCFSSAILAKNATEIIGLSIKRYIIRSGCITIIIIISSAVDLISSILFSKIFSF